MRQMITDSKFHFNHEYSVKVCYAVKSNTTPVYKYAYITVRSENEYSALMTSAIYVSNSKFDCDHIDWIDTRVISCRGCGTSSKFLGSEILEASF